WSIHDALTRPPQRHPRKKREGVVTPKQPPRLIEYEGKHRTIGQLSRRFGVPEATLRRRIKDGWPIDRALTLGGMSGKGGLVADIIRLAGTGGGRHARDTTEIEISG